MKLDAKTKLMIEVILGPEHLEQFLFEDHAVARKCTAAEKEYRLQTIRKLIVAGISIHDIAAYCEERFGIGAKQVQKYLKHIYAQFRRLGQRDAEVSYGLAMERLEAFLVECHLIGDRDNQFKALRELNELQSLKKLSLDITSKGARVTFIIGGGFVPDAGRPEQTAQPQA